MEPMPIQPDEIIQIPPQTEEIPIPVPIEMQLHNAAERGDIDALYAVIAQDPNILNQMDDVEFVQTPLHVAALNNRTAFAMEVVMLKPSLARKLNTEGYSAMHLALRSGHVEVVRSLLSFDSELVRVKGRYGFTLLHSAAEMDEAGLVGQFLVCCPKSIEDLTSQRQTVVHIAVQNNSLATCTLLLIWLKKIAERQHILSRKDAGGNTILHVAALANNPEAMELFIKCVKVNEKNLEGKTALDLILISQDPTRTQDGYERVREILVRAGAKQGSEVPRGVAFITELARFIDLFSVAVSDGLSNETRNIMLVVAALIANATYQAVLSPPGGYWQADSSTVVTNLSPAPAPALAAPLQHIAGQMIISGPAQFLFVMANSSAFWLSIALILIFTAGLPYSGLLTATILALVLTYFTALSRIAGQHGYVIEVPLLIVSCGLPLCLAYFYVMKRNIISRLATRLSISSSKSS